MLLLSSPASLSNLYGHGNRYYLSSYSDSDFHSDFHSHSDSDFHYHHMCTYTHMYVYKHIRAHTTLHITSHHTHRDCHLLGLKVGFDDMRLMEFSRYIRTQSNWPCPYQLHLPLSASFFRLPFLLLLLADSPFRPSLKEEEGERERSQGGKKERKKERKKEKGKEREREEKIEGKEKERARNRE